MASPVAKKAAGTFVEDPLPPVVPPTLAWVTYEARQGSLRRIVEHFCAAQSEPLDASLVVVERVTADGIQCRIPCRCSDHESLSTFPFDVRFKLNPQTKECVRQ